MNFLLRNKRRQLGAIVEDVIAALNPIIHFDAAESMLVAGGGQAGYRDQVAILKDLSGNDNDATQSSIANQPEALPLIDGSGYAHLPGVAGNTFSALLPTQSEDAIAVTTVPASALSEVTVGGGVVVIGAGNSPFFIKSVAISVNGVEVLVIDFTKAPHFATSFVCETGQTVTVNQSGANPALIVGKPIVYSDGVNDVMTLSLSSMQDGDYTVFWRGSRTSGSNNEFFLGTLQAAENRGLNLGFRNASTVTHAAFANDDDLNVAPYSGVEAELHVYRQRSPTGRLTRVLSGGAVSEIVSDRIGLQGTAVGALFQGFSPNTRFSGFAEKLVIFDRALTDTEVVSVQEALHPILP